MFKCKDCQNRHPNCHSECESYLEEKARLKEINENEYLNRKVSQGIREQKELNVYRATKRKR